MTVDHCESSAQAPASDRRHRYLREFAHDGDDFGDPAYATVPAAIALAPHIVQVAPGRIGIAGASGNNAANLFIVANAFKKINEFVEESYAQGVFLFRPVECQPGDAFLFVDIS